MNELASIYGKDDGYSTVKGIKYVENECFLLCEQAHSAEMRVTTSGTLRIEDHRNEDM